MRLSKEKKATHLHDLHSLDLASVLDVRTAAQIDKGTAAVDCAVLSLDKVVDIVKLILGVGEHLLQVLLGNLQSLELLLLLADLLRSLVESRPVGLLHDFAVT